MVTRIIALFPSTFQLDVSNPGKPFFAFFFSPFFLLGTMGGFRLNLMRSDSELQIFTFRSEKKIGLLMQSDIAKSDRIKSDLGI